MSSVVLVMYMAALIVAPFHVDSPQKALGETGPPALLHDTDGETGAVLQWGSGPRDTGFRFLLPSSASSPAWNRVWTDSKVRPLPMESAVVTAPSRPLRLLQQSLLL